MTSRNLFFRLLKEDLKKRAWAIALMFVTMFFSLPVVTAMHLSDKNYQYMKEMLPSDIKLMKTEYIKNLVAFDSPLVVFILIAASVILAVSSFSYLHNKRKVDFYHSLSIRREMLFQVQFTGGILIGAGVYLVNILLVLIISAFSSLDMKVISMTAVSGYLMNLLFFVLMYAAVVLAMMMTGNMIVGLLGAAVFNFYIPGVTMLFLGLAGTFLHQYRVHDTPWTARVSPFIFYMWNLDRYDQNVTEGKLFIYVLITLAAIIGFIVASMVLYWKRPSEAAGKAMAFSLSRPVVKVLLSTAFGVAGALLFYEMRRNSAAWGIFGAVVGTVISHCVIEIIYHMDFKKLFHGKACMGGCLAAVLAVFFGFYFDITGYDQFIPKEEKVDSAFVVLNIDSGWSYEAFNEYGVDRDGNPVRIVIGNEEYARRHMFLTDLEPVLQMAQIMIDFEEAEKKEMVESYSDYISVSLYYRMKSGKEVSRSYYLPEELVEEQVAKLLSDEAYLVGAYPIFSAQPEEITGEIGAVQYLEMNRSFNLEESSQWQQQLFETYRQELKGLTVETRKKEVPIASLQFVTKEEIKYMDLQKEKNYRIISSNDICVSYPIYPSFTKTIDMLKEAGIEAGKHLDYDTITEAVVSYQFEVEGDHYEVKDFKFVDEKDLEEIRKVFIPYMYAERNSLYYFEASEDKWYAELRIKNGFSTEGIDGFLTELPECVTNSISEFSRENSLENAAEDGLK